MSRSGSDSADLTDHQQQPDAPKQPKSTSDFDSLSRCAACYNPNMNSMTWRGEDGESSSSAGDSGPELSSDSESESESSSSSSWSAVEETPEEPEMETRLSAHDSDADDAEPESAAGDADGREGTGEMLHGQRGERGTKGRIKRAPLVKSLTLPPSFTPHLRPVSLLPRPRTMVSTLHLQVLPKVHKDDTVINICQQLPKRHKGKSEERYGRGKGGEDGDGGGGGAGGGQQPGNYHKPLPFQVEHMMLPWQQSSPPMLQQQQQQMSYPYQHFHPVSAQGKESSPALHTQPMSHLLTPYTQPQLWRTNAQQTQHLHTLPPQPCWYCHCLHDKAPASNFW
ncbi:hypothetical protein JOB18_029207 [Solea senegalensis]|nr:hypothetical protein JOB18_029207 [Solea senegalensis]